MQRALRADGEKLLNLTGRDHGPEFWLTCEACFGEGSIEIPEPQHDDPYYCRVVKCECCNGVGLVQQ